MIKAFVTVSAGLFRTIISLREEQGQIVVCNQGAGDGYGIIHAALDSLPNERSGLETACA
jgi:hypothetical protein